MNDLYNAVTEPVERKRKDARLEKLIAKTAEGAMKKMNYASIFCASAAGALVGSIAVPLIISIWWPAKVVSIKESMPNAMTHVTDINLDIPRPLKISGTVGAISGGAVGLAIAARSQTRCKRSGRV